MNKQILIVDDEQDILTALKTFYEHYDLDVMTENNCKYCIKYLEQGFIVILLIDIMMPGMDGWDTIKEIVRRGYASNVSIKIITGRGSKDHKKIEAFAPYISDYISKPFDMDILLSIVKQAS
ncbi:MAG: response regulator [Thermoplasmatota archaeon]